MPETEVEKTIPRIYKRSALNKLMYGYVKGMRRALSTISVEYAIEEFMKDFGLTHDTYNKLSALSAFNRMQQEHREIL